MDAAHSGFPCGSFSRARYREGSEPPPVRSKQWIYGLPTNDVKQQAEAGLGSLLHGDPKRAICGGPAPELEAAEGS